MRLLALVFAVLIAALQYPLWLGKGGWLQVRELDRALAQANETNSALKARNDALDAEVRDLKTGYEAIEERARAELGMIRHDEVFFQIQPDSSAAAARSRLSDRPEMPVATLKNAGAAGPATQLR